MSTDALTYTQLNNLNQQRRPRCAAVGCGGSVSPEALAVRYGKLARWSLSATSNDAANQHANRGQIVPLVQQNRPERRKSRTIVRAKLRGRKQLSADKIEKLRNR